MRPYGHRVCDFSYSGASDCGRDVPAPQGPSFALPASGGPAPSQASNAQTLRMGRRR
jgi:hypothetical protein